jgi:hypothetical protein
MPSPALYWGGEKAGGRVPSSNLLRAMYGPEIPLTATFNVVSWTAKAVNMKAPERSGTGGNVASLTDLRNLVPSGTEIFIRARVRRPDGVVEDVEGTWVKP